MYPSLYGKFVSTLPEGLVPKEQWPEFKVEALPQAFCNPVQAGQNPKGVRWSLWPLTFEEYVSDEEPDLSVSDPHKHARNRLVMWRRITRTTAAPRWWTPTRTASRLEGFAELQPGDYWTTWSGHARRQRKKWLMHFAEKTYRIRHATYAEYEQGYAKSLVAKKTMRESNRAVEQMEARAPEIMSYWVAQRLHDGAIKAGIACINSDATGNSYYAAGFYHVDTQDTPLMIGLMDTWYRDRQQRGYRFLHMGQFWIPGEPKAWKGFSTFKAKFGLFYISYPPLLYKFVRGRLW
jgi:hypothetical protein